MKIRTGILGIMFVAILTIFPQHVFATEAQNTDIYNYFQSEQDREENDPQYGRANGEIDPSFQDSDNTISSDGITKKSANYGSRQQISSYTQQTYTHQDQFDNKEVHNGIDVSDYQGVIDWNQVKQAGIEFAFIRVAARGKIDGALHADSNFITNLQNANAAGIKIGAYIYSQAITPDEGVEEANYIMNLIKGYNVTLPVIMDYEYAYKSDPSTNTSKLGGRLYDAKLSKDTATSVVQAFLKTVNNQGYTSMLYAGKSMLNDQLNANNIKDLVWLANFTTQTNYTGTFTAWQYADTGTVAGINTSVDTDFWYGDLSATNPNTNYIMMARMYNPNSGEHFYTGSYEERVNLLNMGWNYEGVGWYGPRISNTPVYRLYNPNAGDHVYTKFAEERDNLVKAGWTYETIGWYSDDNEQVPLYREYNPNARVGTHNYTRSIEEHNRLIGLGWNDEGLAWSGVNPS